MLVVFYFGMVFLLLIAMVVVTVAFFARLFMKKQPRWWLYTSVFVGSFLAMFLFLGLIVSHPEFKDTAEDTARKELISDPSSIDEKESVGEEESDDAASPDDEQGKVTDERSVEDPVVDVPPTTPDAEKEKPKTDPAKGPAGVKLVPVELVKPVDGDTIKVRIDGRDESVRFLLVDTPETVHPQIGKQPFGEEASDFTKSMIQNGQIALEFDVSDRDKYGRLLAYVYVDGVSVQEELLKAGLARVAYVYAPNTKYVDRYYALQKEAQQKAVGIWSIENYATDDGFHAEVVEGPKKETATPPAKKNAGGSACNIKGNISSSGEKIYHSPDGQFYERTDAEEMFCSTQEAEAAGFRASKR